jgi:hypothetical protein
MAITSISRIQQRRGRANSGTGLPQLASGELGWAIDTQELYIGNGAVSEGAPFVGNTRILTEHDILAVPATLPMTTQSSYVELFKLPLPSNGAVYFIISYSSRLSLSPNTRFGDVKILVDIDNKILSISDDFQFVGSTTYKDLILFNAVLLNQNNIPITGTDIPYSVSLQYLFDETVRDGLDFSGTFTFTYKTMS